MKLNPKAKIALVLIGIGFIFAFSSILSQNFKLYSDVNKRNTTIDNDKSDINKSDLEGSIISEKIVIWNNWTAKSETRLIESQVRIGNDFRSTDCVSNQILVSDITVG